MSRRCKVVILLTLGLLLSHALSPVDTEAAWDPAGEVGVATYEVIPSQGKVHVTLNLNLTNLDREAMSQGEYYRPWSTSIPNEATDVRIYDAERPLRITSITPGENWAVYKYEFNTELWYGTSYSFTMEFDIPVDGNTASFTAWGYANTTTVRVLVPTGYYGEVTLSKEGYSTSTEGTRTVYTYYVPQDGRNFYSRVAAFRTTDYQAMSGMAELKVKTARITVEFWEGEGGKATHILSLYQAALPAMEDLWDIPFPPGYTIIVREGTYQDTKGFAGHNSGRQGITVLASYMGRDATLLHELAHYWANRPPLGERWLWEGYAELYAYLTLLALGDNLTAKHIIDSRAQGFESRKAECDFPLSEWVERTAVGSCTTTLGYGKSTVFVLDLYERFGLSTFKDINGIMFSWEQDVDWFDYLHILETATGQELGRTFVGWVVPQGFGTTFQQWQSAERGYWAAHGKVAQSRGALGINRVEALLESAKSLIKDGDFSPASNRLTVTGQFYAQWQLAFNAYTEAKTAVATAADTMGIESVEDSLSLSEASLADGDYGNAELRAHTTLSLFNEWQQAVKAFRDAEAAVGQPADSLGFQTVRGGLDKAQSLLTGGQFSQVAAQTGNALSLFSQWERALEAYREAESAISQPADTLGLQPVLVELDKAKNLLAGSWFAETVDQVDSTLSLFSQWQAAIGSLREAEASVAQAQAEGRTWNLRSAETTFMEARNLLSGGELEKSLVQSQVTEEMATQAVTPVRAIAPYIGVALAALAALVGGIVLLRRGRRRPVAG